ncbi:type VI secretion system tube protein TssD, partial [Flavobacterium oreochromis]
FSEHFDAKSDEPLQIAMRLMAKRFTLNDATHEKKWKE